MRKPLREGTLVRAKVRTAFGWKGLGTVKYDDGGEVVTIRKLPPKPDDMFNTAEFCRDQLSVVRTSRSV